MLSLLSRVKSKLLRRLGYEKYISNLDAILTYPHDNDEVDKYIEKLERKKKNFISGEAFSSSINYPDLKARFKYLNSRNRFSESLLCYSEILTRESRWSNFMRPAGLRKIYMAKFLLSESVKPLDSRSFHSLLRLCKNYEGYDNAFEKLVTGKNIAIIGGAPSVEESGCVIDQFDLVTRININTTKKFNVNIVGSRCDIVYIRGERGELISKNPMPYFSDGDSEKTVYRLKIKEQLRSMPLVESISLACNFDEIFNYGHLNAVQAAMLDLFVHGASSVKIFNVDFNLSGSAFAGYRPDNLSSVQFDKIFVAHPPHPQFDLCKKLHALGFLRGDAKFESIIASDMPDFISKCDERWSLENH